MNRRRSFRVIRLACLLLCCGGPVSAADDLEQLEQDAFYAAAERAAASVVRIEALGGLEKVGQALASVAPTSGIVVSEDGFIITSAVGFEKKPSSILVQLPDGTRKAARSVAQDHSRHLVLLKIDVDQPLRLPAVAPKDKVVVGQWAITVGKTLSETDFHITVGIVSAKNRIWGRALQTDANVSPTNYGGALVDIHGRVLGVLVPLSPDSDAVNAGTQWYDSGIGFAVPLEDVMASFDRLKQGDLYAGKLGVALSGNDTYGVAPKVGVSRPNSPARDAGIQSGDTLLRINGVPVRRHVDVRHQLGPLYAGERVEIEYARGDDRFEKQVELVDKLLPYEHAFLGILPERVRPEEDDKGVFVRYVFEGSPAAQMKLEAGDQILELGGIPVQDAASLRQALAGREPGEELAVRFVRAGSEESAQAKLGTLPEAIPKSLPPAMGHGGDVEERPPLGRLAIRLPEETSECEAYIPQSYDPRTPHALLVVLPVPGKDKVKDVLDRWRGDCEREGVVLLVPGFEDTKAWRPSELAFVRKTVENLQGQYKIDAERIVIHGAENSGAMALLAAFSARDVFRGVSATDAIPPRGAPGVFSEPLQRLAVLLSVREAGPMAARAGALAAQLRTAKIPVTVLPPAKELERGALFRWIDSLDRI